MPQLDPSSYASQLFWLTVTFVFLYLILARFILPRVQTVLEGREGRISGDLSLADALKNEAEASKAAYEKSLHDAKHAAQTMIADARKTMNAEAAEQQAKLDKDLAVKIAEAERAIETSRKHALDQLVPVTADLTCAIVETLVHYKPDPKKVGQLVSEYAKQKGLV